ncbi:sugar kinase [Siculibacillus lacustris]|uniref:Sugar kinase n=1 Tax=Siculibacillus lacustris TaxID=1549641 RepID=A0A4Q9VKC7_9HYPH|nr:FGGY-family carbohydrate kinase [Siculibacillus lacustris]TBW35823.1 sugar kinase [Siculibacillus lacustris]
METLGTPLFVGIDIGSASVRAGLYDPTGRRLAFHVGPILQFRPRAGFVEQSSADIWANACAAVRGALAEAGVDGARVAAIGVDATCSLVAVGDDGPISVSEAGEPDHDVIMWMDHRAGDETAAINATDDPALAYVGGEVSIEMELPKVLWLKRHFPARHAKVRRYHDLADHIVWRATGADVASVCTLGCKWNWLAHERRFPLAMLAAVGLDDLPGKVPAEVLPLGSVAGGLSAAAAAEMGLTPGIAVATGIIDAHAGGLALVGATPQGTLALIGGTSNCHMVVARDPVMVPGVWGPYFGAMLPGWWLNEGGQSAAGALLDWTIRQSSAYPDVAARAAAEDRNIHAVLGELVAALEAREPRPTRDLHVLPDHHGNRSPRADPEARGSLVGLTLEEGPDALARLYLATIQALAYGTRHILEAMNAAGHRIDRLVMCGGGTKNPLLLREHADAVGCDIHLVEDEDAVTLGAGLLAAVAAGHFPDIPAAAAAMVRPGATIVADPAARAFHDAKYQVFLELYDQQKRCRDLMDEQCRPKGDCRC